MKAYKVLAYDVHLKYHQLLNELGDRGFPIGQSGRITEIGCIREPIAINIVGRIVDEKILLVYNSHCMTPVSTHPRIVRKLQRNAKVLENIANKL